MPTGQQPSAYDASALSAAASQRALGQQEGVADDVVFIIDEAHLLASDQLEELRLLTNMDLAESATYLRHHLALVGRTDPLFADDAVARLHKVSLGLPRAFNYAAIAALIAAASAGKALVDDDCARKAWPN